MSSQSFFALANLILLWLVISNIASMVTIRTIGKKTQLIQKIKATYRNTTPALPTLIVATLCLPWNWSRPENLVLIGGILTLSILLRTTGGIALKQGVSQLNTLNQQNAVASIELQKENQTLSIWFTHTAESWPPLRSEVGINGFTQPTQGAPQTLLDDTSKALIEHHVLEDKTLQEKLKEALLKAGVTHPMDIEGLEALPSLHQFLENLLLTKKTELPA